MDSESEYTPGDRADFDRLYSTTYPRVYGTLVTLLRNQAAAEDCAQEAYVKAYRAWSKWRKDAPAEAWVHRIAINTAVSYRRREKLQQVTEILRRLGRPSEAQDPEETATSPLVKALQALPARQGSALTLRYLHGYSNREIAEILGIPEPTVASRLATARRALEAMLTQFSEEMVTLEDSSVPLVKTKNERPRK